MRYLRLILLFLVSGLLSCNQGYKLSDLPKAKEGILDLRSWEPKTIDPITLDGNWLFYWKELYNPNSEMLPVQTPISIAVPRSWNGTVLPDGSLLTGEGYATYYLKVLLPPSVQGKNLAFKFQYVATANRIFVNGKEVANSGQVSIDSDHSVPFYKNQIRSTAVGEEIEIWYQVSNYSHRKGGLWQSVLMGTEEGIHNSDNLSHFYDFFLFGVLSIMCIYHFGLFLLRREEGTYFFFGFFCLIISIRILFTGETWITTLFPSIDWNLQIKIEYITFYFSTQVFASFVYYLYPMQFRKIPWIVINVIGLVFVCLVLFTKPLLFTHSLPYFQLFTLVCGVYCLYALIVSIRKNEIGAIAAMVGWLIFFIAIIGDFIVNEIYGSSYLTPLGLFVFILSQSFILSLIFSKTFRSTQSLSIHLTSTNLAYSRFVPKDFIQFLNREDITEVSLGDQTEMEMTVMFCDIRKFTSLSESLTPEQTFRFINAYLERVGPIVRKNKGFIDKYMGDGFMALFPVTPEDACRAAIEIQDKVYEYNIHRKNSNYVPIQVGIGIHVGKLMLGTIGEANRMDATVISDAVNLSSRLEGLTKIFGTGILVSKEVYSRIKNKSEFPARQLGRVQVKGKSEHLDIMELIHDSDPNVAQMKRITKEDFMEALTEYLNKDFLSASQKFKQILEKNPNDVGVQLFYNRAESFKHSGVDTGWNGVEIFEIK